MLIRRGLRVVWTIHKPVVKLYTFTEDRPASVNVWDQTQWEKVKDVVVQNPLGTGDESEWEKGTLYVRCDDVEAACLYFSDTGEYEGVEGHFTFKDKMQQSEAQEVSNKNEEATHKTKQARVSTPPPHPPPDPHQPLANHIEN